MSEKTPQQRLQEVIQERKSSAIHSTGILVLLLILSGMDPIVQNNFLRKSFIIADGIGTLVLLKNISAYSFVALRLHLIQESRESRK